MIKIEKELELTPYELAEELWNKDDDEQAIFFSALGRYFYEAQGKGMTQLDYIAMNVNLDDKGKWFIKTLLGGLVVN